MISVAVSVLISTIPEPKHNVYISINHCRHIYTEYILPSPYVYTVSIYPCLLYPIIYPSMFALFHHCTYKYKRTIQAAFPLLFVLSHTLRPCMCTCLVNKAESLFLQFYTFIYIILYMCEHEWIKVCPKESKEKPEGKSDMSGACKRVRACVCVKIALSLLGWPRICHQLLFIHSLQPGN